MTKFEEIEREVIAERQKFAASLDALSSAIDPENVKQHASGIAESYGGDLGRQAWDTAKQNPAAFALVGAGLALMLSGTGARAETQNHQAPAPNAKPQTAGFDNRLAAADEKIKRQMSGTLEKDPALHSAQMKDNLETGLEALPKAARERVIKARKAAIKAQERIERETHIVAQKSKTLLHDQPLVVGAIALGLGTLVGALLPSTRREDALLGQQRDAVMAAAKATLAEELDKVQETAAATLKTSKVSAG